MPRVRNPSSEIEINYLLFVLTLRRVRECFRTDGYSESLSEGLVCLLLLIKINWLLVLPEKDYRMDRRAQQRR
jgi:hypothetical protein